MSERRLEAWQRGPVPGIPALLQPVAHALLQARSEATEVLTGFPDALLWERPAGVASVGFHLRHLAGILDRLFTYARGEQLNAAQLQALDDESVPAAATAAELLARFSGAVDDALRQLANTPDHLLLEPREVGRARLPSTVLGLLFHAAEHSQRHLGQILVTVRVLLTPEEEPAGS